MKRRQSSTMFHQMEGRKREKQVGEIRNMGGQKRGLTNWRGGRGRSELVSFETWQVTNEDSASGGEGEGGGRRWASEPGTAQMRNNYLGGREAQKRGGGGGNVRNQQRVISSSEGGTGRRR